CELYAALLEKKLHHENYRILPDKTIRIYEPQYEAAGYSALAGGNNLGINKLEMRKTTLEEYYMRLKTEGKA
ncbi:MAG: ABC transporter ATP-binding protein, partial [Lachnospiraceae bacterium]|nr:ABC transporter ATP-binding protein [Lachnospiraceae bacterium]